MISVKKAKLHEPNCQLSANLSMRLRKSINYLQVRKRMTFSLFSASLFFFMCHSMNLVFGQSASSENSSQDVNLVSVRCESDDCESLANFIFQTTFDGKSVTDKNSCQVPYMISKVTHQPCLDDLATMTSKNAVLQQATPQSTLLAGAKSIKPKLILYWTSAAKNYGIGIGKNAFSTAKCNIDSSNCETTDNRMRLSESDAVIFSWSDFKVSDLPDPSTRKPNQRYILLMFEELNPNNPVFAKYSSNYFNWTMTRRRDSDIFISKPYGAINRKTTNSTLLNDLYPARLTTGMEKSLPPTAVIRAIQDSSRLDGKDKSLKIAWLCDKDKMTHGGREKYIEHLKQVIKVDILDVDGTCPNIKNVDCRPPAACDSSSQLKKYKFYLAAEMFICTDLVTERFYQHLDKDIVPVVYGGADYTKFAPPNSYINAAHFKSPYELAKYLDLLNNNDALYLSYFDWKKEFEYQFNPTKSFCELCNKLHKDDGTGSPQNSSSYGNNLSKWWFDESYVEGSTNNDSCLPGAKYLAKFNIY